MGECRRTVLVRFVTMFRLVSPGVASQNIKGGERSGRQTAGWGFVKTLFLGRSVNFNCAHVACQSRIGCDHNADEDDKGGQERQCVFEIFAVHDCVL